MQTSVTFKNLDPSETLKSYVGEKLDRFDKFLDNPAEANVVLSVEKFRHIAEINIIGDRLNIVGKEETNDMYSAIDMVLDKLEKQIKKSKQKTRDRRGGIKSGLERMAEGSVNLPEDAGDRQI
ncbi:MAG: ribosome-associated translation inhibitor RaiA, partial [Desulfobacterales bacterium]|nr:ribosome-associated translation inhibitor RaiA [Desulfobacterales bacterium]